MTKRLIYLIVLLVSSFLVGTPIHPFQQIIYFNTLGGSPVPTFVGTREAFFYKGVPFKEGHGFDGWYFDRAYERPFEKSLLTKFNKTVYAKWVPLEKTNVFQLSYMASHENKREYTLYINGLVNMHAYDIGIHWDEALSLEDTYYTLNQVVNCQLSHRLRFNYIDLEEGLKFPQAIITFTLNGDFHSTEDVNFIIHDTYINKD